MPDAGVELTITVRQEGAEAAQAQVQQLKGTMREVAVDAVALDSAARRSISKFAIALNLVVSSALALTDLLGVQIEAVYKQLIGVLMSYVNQMMMIAMSMSFVNPALAAAAAAAAAGLQSVAVVQTNADMREAAQQLRASSQIIRNFSIGLRSLGGT